MSGRSPRSDRAENPRVAELTNFYGHCSVAGMLATHELKAKTVLNSYRVHAIRKASDCWTGANGVRYASAGAILQQASQGTSWQRSGLIKEHTVPVAVINSFVLDALRSALSENTSISLPATFTEDSRSFPSSVVELFQQDPRAWLVATVVMEWTLHAWITETEDLRFDDKDRHGGISIRKRMPSGWVPGHDLFARYVACEIQVVPIQMDSAVA